MLQRLILGLLLIPSLMGVGVPAALAATALGHGISRCGSEEIPQATISVTTSGITVPEIIRPSQPITFDRADDVDDATVWYFDGLRIPGPHPLHSCFIFTDSGIKRIEVATADSTLSALLNIEPFSRIFIARLLPDPLGSDVSEQVVLHNDNPFAVNLEGWELKSRIAKTAIPISIAIAAQSEAVVTAKNRLRNSDGVYDLYNESGEIVDTVQYDSSVAGTYLVRNGIFFDGQATATSEKYLEGKKNPTTISVSGKVVKPSGRTIDIVTNDGTPYRLVLHKSYTRPKPTIHTGDSVTASGSVLRSKRGPYISVRASDSFVLVSQARNVASKKSDPDSPKESNPLVSEVPQLSPFRATISSAPIYTTETVLPMHSPWLPLLFVSMITTGASLLYPPRKKAV